MRLAVYPGTFDPLTNGHISLVRRGLDVFDRVVLGIARDTYKTPLFSLEERAEMARDAFSGSSGVVVETFSGLLVDYVDQCGASVILRGLRANSDFEYEFQMALMNRRLKRNIHTMFMMTDYKWLFTSSSSISPNFSRSTTFLICSFNVSREYGRITNPEQPDPIASRTKSLELSSEIITTGI